jgi:beta-glucosidase
MTLEEKVDQMHGSSLAAVDDLFLTPDNARLGIPGFRMVDGPRGVRAGRATAFPVAMARGASFDPELERRVGRAIGREAAARGANVILAPTINILRHPAWGRAQETYGEDTTHIGAMGVAFIEGAQEHVLASAKHFACNSIEDTRFDVDVTIDERTLREVYLPHFRRAVVDAKVGSVMSAYNQVNGHYASENAHLIRDILKGEWAFDGFVESDWVFGTRSTVAAANAGLDIEMPAATYFGPWLVEAVQAGEVDEAVIDEAATRVVRKKVELGASMTPQLDPDVIESAEHLALAREAARAGMVLLKNEGALPLARAAGTLVVVGELATVAEPGRPRLERA